MKHLLMQIKDEGQAQKFVQNLGIQGTFFTRYKDDQQHQELELSKNENKEFQNYLENLDGEICQSKETIKKNVADDNVVRTSKLAILKREVEQLEKNVKVIEEQYYKSSILTEEFEELEKIKRFALNNDNTFQNIKQKIQQCKKLISEYSKIVQDQVEKIRQYKSDGLKNFIEVKKQKEVLKNLKQKFETSDQKTGKPSKALSTQLINRKKMSEPQFDQYYFSQTQRSSISQQKYLKYSHLLRESVNSQENIQNKMTINTSNNPSTYNPTYLTECQTNTFETSSRRVHTQRQVSSNDKQTSKKEKQQLMQIQKDIKHQNQLIMQKLNYFNQKFNQFDSMKNLITECFSTSIKKMVNLHSISNKNGLQNSHFFDIRNQNREYFKNKNNSNASVEKPEQLQSKSMISDIKQKNILYNTIKCLVLNKLKENDIAENVIVSNLQQLYIPYDLFSQFSSQQLVSIITLKQSLLDQITNVINLKSKGQAILMLKSQLYFKDMNKQNPRKLIQNKKKIDNTQQEYEQKEQKEEVQQYPQDNLFNINIQQQYSYQSQAGKDISLNHNYNSMSQQQNYENINTNDLEITDIN